MTRCSTCGLPQCKHDESQLPLKLVLSVFISCLEHRAVLEQEVRIIVGDQYGAHRRVADRLSLTIVVGGGVMCRFVHVVAPGCEALVSPVGGQLE